MCSGKRDPDRDLNLLPHVTHILVPTVTHVTTSTLSPTLTVVLPVATLHAKTSHGLYSQQSTLTVTPDGLTSAMFTVNYDQTSNHHIFTTFTALAKDDLLHHLPVTNTVVRKVSTLTHDPDTVLNPDVSVTHVTDTAPALTSCLRSLNTTTCLEVLMVALELVLILGAVGVVMGCVCKESVYKSFSCGL
jgi:hypothetical protein